MENLENDLSNDISSWEVTPDEMTITGLQKICENLIEARKEKDNIEITLKSCNESIKVLEQKILVIMKEHNLPNFKGDFGSISIKTTRSISQPESMEEKLKFFGYLKDQGIFDEMVSVNSRTLSSWATKEIEAHEKKGEFGFQVPGLKPAKEFQSLSVRKA